MPFWLELAPADAGREKKYKYKMKKEKKKKKKSYIDMTDMWFCFTHLISQITVGPSNTHTHKRLQEQSAEIISVA